MATQGGSGSDVVIRLRLDTAQAEADLKRFQAGIGAVTVATGRFTGGGVPGGAPAGGGSAYGLPGLNIGRMIAGYGVAAAFGGADIAGSAANLIGGAGSLFSEQVGFADYRRRTKAPAEATRMTVEQLGLVGNVVSKEQANSMRGFNLNMLNALNSAETRVRSLVGGSQGKDYEELLVEALEMFIQHWPAVVGALVGGAAAGATGAVVLGGIGEVVNLVSGIK